MNIKRYLAAFRLNFRVQLTNISLQAILIAIPLIMIPFLFPAFKVSLQAQGHLTANGSEQVLPGFAILFSMLSLQMVLQLFFNEHARHTWDRMRVSATSLLELVSAKLSVAFLVQIAQICVVMLIGSAIFGYRPKGSITQMALVFLVFSSIQVVIGLLAYALLPTFESAVSFSNMLGMLLAGIGGGTLPCIDLSRLGTAFGQDQSCILGHGCYRRH